MVHDVHRVTTGKGEAFQVADFIQTTSTVLQMQGRRRGAEGNHSRSREGTHRHQLLYIHLRADPGHGVSQSQASFRIRVVDLDRRAVEGCEDVVGSVGVGPDHVLGDRPDEDHRTSEQLSVLCQVDGRAEDAGTSTHVTLHATSMCPLDVQTAGIEHQCLAHVGGHLVRRSAEWIHPGGEHTTVATVTGGYRVEQTHLGVLVEAGFEDLKTHLYEKAANQGGKSRHVQEVRGHGAQPTTDIGRTCEFQPLVDRRELALFREENDPLDSEVRDLGLQFIPTKKCPLHPHGGELRIDVLQRQPKDHLLAVQRLSLEGHTTKQADDVLGKELAGILAQTDREACPTREKLNIALGTCVAHLEVDACQLRVHAHRGHALKDCSCSQENLPDASGDPIVHRFTRHKLPKVGHRTPPSSLRMAQRRPEVWLMTQPSQALIYLPICIY